MSFCFFYNKIYELINKKQFEEKDANKKKAPSYMMAIPSFCDVFATIIDSIGLIYTHVSVH